VRARDKADDKGRPAFVRTQKRMNSEIRREGALKGGEKRVTHQKNAEGNCVEEWQ
jgi:hypothetical protein